MSHFVLSFEKETIQQKGESACGANNDPSPRTHTNAYPRFPFPARVCVCVCVLSDGRTVALSVCLKEDFLSFSSRGVIPEKDLPSLVGRTSCDWELPVTDTHAHTHTSTNTIWRMHQCPDVRLCLIYVHPVVSLLTSPNWRGTKEEDMLIYGISE